MPADTAKYLLTIADLDPKNVEITAFSGIDAIISAPRTSAERLHGLHFPSKRGAEMVLAYVNGNPDKPVGLGFVPNAAAPSVARNINCVDNVMRSWGGNELVMNDSHSRENIRLSTPTVRYLELHDGDELARLKSADSELIFHDAENYAEINVGGHTIQIIYRDKEGDISATTVDGNMIKMNDPENVITVQNAEEKNKAVLDGKNKTITFDSVENTLTISGDDKKIALESKDSKAAVDGSGKRVSFESKDNSLVISGASNSISLNAKGDIYLNAGGKIIFDAKSGVSNIGASIYVDPDGSGPGSSPSVVSEQKAASANVRSAARAESGTKKSAAGTDGAGGTETGKSSPESTGTDDNDDPKQEVANMYWTYGEDHIKLEKERSRHYVDLNLHVETKNYEDGENVKIVLRRDDKLPIYDSTAEIPLEGTVIDNHAVVDNVFQERLLNIGLQGDAAEKIVPTVMLPDGTEDARPEAALDPHRPSWDAVYEGYPLQFRGTDNVKEETKENVFISVLGEKYDTKTFNNACATRVSIALIKANMRVKKDFLVQVGKHAGQGFIASAKGLQEWLSQENVWNTADVTVDKTDKDTFPGKTNLEIIREKLNGKKGVYIILGGFQKGITGHATLWTGTDVIGGKDDDVEDNTYSSHIDNGATVYFWELKDVPQKTIVTAASRVQRILVNGVKGKAHALPGEKITYEVTNYDKDGITYNKDEINGNNIGRVKWAINVDGRLEEPLNDAGNEIFGETLPLTIKDEWAGKTITVMPYLREPTRGVSVETTIFTSLIITTETDVDLFTLDGTDLKLPKRITVKNLYYEHGFQWFEPTANKYIRLLSIEPDFENNINILHFSWDEIVKFAEIDRAMFQYGRNRRGDWKSVKTWKEGNKNGRGGAGYILVSVGGVPYWGDAIGQIPFALNCFRQQLVFTQNHIRAKLDTIEAGKKHGNGGIFIPKRDDDEKSPDNKMILRAVNWASRRYRLENGIILVTSHSPQELSIASNGVNIR